MNILLQKILTMNIILTSSMCRIFSCSGLILSLVVLLSLFTDRKQDCKLLGDVKRKFSGSQSNKQRRHSLQRIREVVLLTAESLDTRKSSGPKCFTIFGEKHIEE